MEQTEFSETSAYKIPTPGNYPEEKHKMRIIFSILLSLHMFQYNEGINHQILRSFLEELLSFMQLLIPVYDVGRF
jgi:hypothetical protein